MYISLMYKFPYSSIYSDLPAEITFSDTELKHFIENAAFDSDSIIIDVNDKIGNLSKQTKDDRIITMIHQFISAERRMLHHLCLLELFHNVQYD